MWESPEPSRMETRACFEAKAKREENLNSEVKEVKKSKKKKVSTVKKIV